MAKINQIRWSTGQVHQSCQNRKKPEKLFRSYHVNKKSVDDEGSDGGGERTSTKI